MDSIADKLYFLKQNLRRLKAQMRLNKGSMDNECERGYFTVNRTQEAKPNNGQNFVDFKKKQELVKDNGINSGQIIFS